MGGGSGGMRTSQRKGGGQVMHHEEFRDRGPHTSTLSVNEPWDEALADSLREMFAEPGYDGGPLPAHANSPFQRFLNASSYGRDDHAQLVSPQRLDRLVREQRSPYLYMILPGGEGEAPTSSYSRWLTEGRPVSVDSGVAMLVHPRHLTESDRYLRATFKPNVRMNVITNDQAIDLLRRFEAAHGRLVDRSGGFGAEIRASMGAKSALAAAKGFDVIRFGTPDTGYSYRVLNRGVLVTDGVGGPYRGQGY